MSELWHNLRAENIGGSEVAALFGESPYLTYYRLWHEKRGLIEPENLDESERIQAGKFLEAGALQWANYRWGMEFYQPQQYIRHPSIMGMGCTPDAFSSHDPDIMAQVKIVDGIQFNLKWDAEGDTITHAPLDIMLQVQHEMECAQMAYNWLIVLVNGNRLYRMICKYDLVIAKLIRENVQKFWAMEHPPEPNFRRDPETIHALRARMPAKEYVDMSDDRYLYRLVKNAMRATKIARNAKDKVDMLNAEVAYFVGNAKHIRCRDILLHYYDGRKTPKYSTEKDVL